MNKKNMIQTMMVLFLMSSIPLASYGVTGYITDIGVSSSNHPSFYVALKKEGETTTKDFYIEQSNKAHDSIVHTATLAYVLKRKVSLLLYKDTIVKAIYLSK